MNEAKRPKADEPNSDEPNSSLFAKGIPFAMDNDALADAFSGCEGFQSVNIIRDRETGRSRGYGYIQFVSPEAATNALNAMQGAVLQGRTMILAPSQRRPIDYGTRAANRARDMGDVTSQETDTLYVANLPFRTTEDEVLSYFNDHTNGAVASVRLPRLE